MIDNIKRGSLVKYSIEYGIVEDLILNHSNEIVSVTVKLEFNGVKVLPIENIHLCVLNDDDERQILTRIRSKR